MNKRISIHRLLIALLAFALLLSAATPLLAARGDDAERKSKNGKTEGSIDGVDVTIEFGRPEVRDREVWGALVPHDKVWRTGADEATTITFGSDVTIEGKPLAAGTYSLFTIPGAEEWTIIFNRVANLWGTYEYTADKDALRVTAAPEEQDHVEAMNIVIDGSDVVLQWEKLAVGFTVAKAE